MRRSVARAAVVGLTTAALGLVGGAPAPAQAGPVVVATAAEWEAAFADPAVTAIALGGDLEVDCAQARRTATTPVAVDGQGRSIAFTCSGADADIGSAGPLALDDVSLHGSSAASAIVQGEVRLRRVHLEVGGNLVGAVLVGASTMADTTIDLGTTSATGVVTSESDGVVIERTTVTGVGNGVAVGGPSAEPTVIRDSTMAVSHAGLALDDDAVVERTSVRGGLVGLRASGTGVIRVHDSTVVLDPSLAVTGSPSHAVDVSAIEPVDAAIDQSTLVVLDADGQVPRTAVRASGPTVGLDLRATVVVARGPDCTTVDNISTGGDNVTGDDTCGFDGPGDRVLSDLGLEPFDPATGVALPRRGGPLVDAVTTCTSTADQRGVARPQGPRCDVGAVELEPLTEPVPPVTGSAPPGGGGTAPPARPIPGPARFAG